VGEPIVEVGQILYLVFEATDYGSRSVRLHERVAFTKREVAESVAKGASGLVMFGEGSVVPIKVCDSIEQLSEIRREDIRQSALNKLTPEEKKILGIEV
jgi:hypothetical protein